MKGWSNVDVEPWANHLLQRTGLEISSLKSRMEDRRVRQSEAITGCEPLGYPRGELAQSVLCMASAQGVVYWVTGSAKIAEYYISGCVLGCFLRVEVLSARSSLKTRRGR